MSDHDEAERQRQERAKLVSAFNRRAWQPSEQPQLGPRVLAGGAALILVAGAAFGFGAFTSYNHKKAAEQRERQVALTTHDSPALQNQTTGGTPQPAPPQGGMSTPPQSGRAAPGGGALPHTLPEAATGPEKTRPGGNGPTVTPSTSVSSPTRTVTSNGVPSRTESPQKLQALAFQQGGETAPYISRPAQGPTASPTSPKATTPKKALPPSHPAAAGPMLPKGAKSSAASGFLIKNVVTGMCVDIPFYDKGTLDGRVQQHTCDGSSADNQRWDLVVGRKGAGPNGADPFTVRNTKDGYCLDLPGNHPVDHGDVTEQRCDPGPGDNQMWYLEKKSPGNYWIRNVSSKGHQCLDADTRAQDAKLTIYPCSLRHNHLWSFLP